MNFPSSTCWGGGEGAGKENAWFSGWLVKGGAPGVAWRKPINVRCRHMRRSERWGRVSGQSELLKSHHGAFGGRNGETPPTFSARNGQISPSGGVLASCWPVGCARRDCRPATARVLVIGISEPAAPAIRTPTQWQAGEKFGAWCASGWRAAIWNGSARCEPSTAPSTTVRTAKCSAYSARGARTAAGGTFRPWTCRSWCPGRPGLPKMTAMTTWRCIRTENYGKGVDRPAALPVLPRVDEAVLRRVLPSFGALFPTEAAWIQPSCRFRRGARVVLAGGKFSQGLSASDGAGFRCLGGG